MPRQNLDPVLYAALFCVPAAGVVVYFAINQSLALTGAILSVCLCISGVLFYFVLNATVSAVNAKDLELDEASLTEILSKIQKKSANVLEGCGNIELMRRKIERSRQLRDSHKIDAIVEVDLVNMGLVDHLMTLLENDPLLENKISIPAFELFNTIISDTKARDQLFDTMDNLKSTIDRCGVFMCQWLSDIGSNPNGIKLEKLRVKVTILTCIALTLMSINCPAAQSRIGDKGGVFSVHAVLLNKQLLENPQVVLVATCCLLSLTSDHPPNKGELFRIGGIMTMNSILTKYFNNGEICCHTLKLLHNLIGDDRQNKHSLVRAREVCFHLQMTDTVLKIRRHYNQNDQICAIAGAILKLIALNFS